MNLKLVGNTIKKMSQSAPIERHIRFFDKDNCEFIGQQPMLPVNEDYLRKVFGVKDNNPMLFSYRITEKQQVFIERYTGLKLNLNRFEYFMECDFDTIPNAY